MYDLHAAKGDFEPTLGTECGGFQTFPFQIPIDRIIVLRSEVIT
jgi:hypothetical protein